MSKCTNPLCRDGMLINRIPVGQFQCPVCLGTGEMPEKLAESNPEGHQQALTDAHADGVINFEATPQSDSEELTAMDIRQQCAQEIRDAHIETFPGTRALPVHTIEDIILKHLPVAQDLDLKKKPIF